MQKVKRRKFHISLWPHAMDSKILKAVAKSIIAMKWKNQTFHNDFWVHSGWNSGNAVIGDGKYSLGTDCIFKYIPSILDASKIASQWWHVPQHCIFSHMLTSRHKMNAIPKWGMVATLFCWNHANVKIISYSYFQSTRTPSQKLLIQKYICVYEYMQHKNR